MTRERIRTFLNRPQPCPVFEAFCKFMRPRQHSREETIDLWGTFLEGYCAAEEDLRAREKALSDKADAFKHEIIEHEIKIAKLLHP